MYVVFLHGPAAAGKHTVGTLVSEQLGIPLFHNHLTVDLTATLFDFASAPFIRLRATIWQAAFREAAEAGRAFVFTFNPESTVDPATISSLHDAVTAAGGRVHYVAMHCSDEEVLRRIGNPSRARFGKLLDPEIYRQARAQGGFDFPPLPQALVTVDTELTTAADAATLIVAAVTAAEPGQTW
jgi:hypothetical protein